MKAQHTIWKNESTVTTVTNGDAQYAVLVDETTRQGWANAYSLKHGANAAHVDLAITQGQHGYRLAPELKDRAREVLALNGYSVA